MLGYGTKAGEDKDPLARRNRGCIKKYGIQAVTIPYIAYTVMLVSGVVLFNLTFRLICRQTRYALSSDLQLSIDAGDEGHTYASLYDLIVKMLREMSPERLKRLTDVWYK